MLYKVLAEEGEYIDSSSKEPRNLLIAQMVAYTPEGINVGWQRFETLEEALNYFNIEKIKNED